MSTALDNRTDETTELSNYEPGDEERFAHYVKKEDILNANINGVPCRALCGKEWLPNRLAEQFPVCPECKDIYDNVVETKNPSSGSGGGAQ